MKDERLSILQGDAPTVLKTLPENSVQCCVTSPPYWGLRDYGVAGQLGLEKTPEEYIARMVEIFGEVKRVLREDGTLWLNLGDSYAGSGGAHKEEHANPGISNSYKRNGVPHWGDLGQPGNYLAPNGLKPKDLCGVPWRVAMALQADGWWLRSDIIWAKKNCMPESVTDRPTRSHEYIFLLTKSARYYYDAEAVKEPGQNWGTRDRKPGSAFVDGTPGRAKQSGGKDCDFSTGRNARSVWTMATKPYAEAHFATFPPELPERCIKAGTSEKGCCSKCGKPWVRDIEKVGGKGKFTEEGKPQGMGRSKMKWNDSHPTLNPERWMPQFKTTGWSPACTCSADTIPCTVLDPFAGSGTTLMVAQNMGRKSIGIELNPEYIELIKKRCHHPVLL